MPSYYEAHITLEGKPAEIKPRVEKLKWKFSCIDGDINLGDGVKCYATRQFNRRRGQREVLDELLSTANLLCDDFKILRAKVELVIYDTWSSNVDCIGGCPECHTEDYIEPETFNCRDEH